MCSKGDYAMGIMDIFNASKIKKENERLLAELESAKKC